MAKTFVLYLPLLPSAKRLSLLLINSKNRNHVHKLSTSDCADMAVWWRNSVCAVFPRRSRLPCQNALRIRKTQRTSHFNGSYTVFPMFFMGRLPKLIDCHRMFKRAELNRALQVGETLTPKSPPRGGFMGLCQRTCRWDPKKYR